MTRPEDEDDREGCSLLIGALAVVAAFFALALLLAAQAHAQDGSQYAAGGQLPKSPGAVTVVLDGFAVGYRKDWGEPAWSAQHETAASIAAAAKTARNGTFHTCDLPDGSKSVSPDAYAKTGYDLGHQTESASQPDKPPTFGTCNMSPQTPQLNRMIWAGIEAEVRNLSAAQGSCWVVTGPEVLAGAQVIGGAVKVPAKSWKALWCESLGAGAYACTNTAAPICTTESVTALAAEIGLDPFPGVSAAVKGVLMRLPEPTKGGQLAN